MISAKPCKSPLSCWIEGMPKRLREHLRAQEIVSEAETAAYPWMCEKCRRVFLPTRLPEFIAVASGRQFQWLCPDCQIRNLMNAMGISKDA